MYICIYSKLNKCTNTRIFNTTHIYTFVCREKGKLADVVVAVNQSFQYLCRYKNLIFHSKLIGKFALDFFM